MANPNSDVWGAPETWIQEQYLPAVNVTGYRAIKPRIANFGSNNGTLSAGNTAGKTPINKSLDATICPCGQDPAISPFAKIRFFKNHQNADLNKVPDQTVENTDTCNWFLYEGTGGSLYTDHCNETGAAWRWLPDATISNNMDGRVQPYVYWQTLSLLISVELIYIESYSQGIPNFNTMRLDQWAANPTRKIADIKLQFLGLDSASSSLVNYKTGTAASMSDGRWGGVGYIGKVFNGTERYILNVYNTQLSFDVFGHLKSNAYASSPYFALNNADMFEGAEIKGGYRAYDTSGGWAVWYEIPYSESNANKVLSIAALFGCPFTPTTRNSFPVDLVDNDLYLPIVDNIGIAHGEYTHGTRNVDNPLYTADSVRDMGYDPYRVYYGTYCNVCGYGGEYKSICPRCHATGDNLLNIPAMAQGPIWKLDPDDPQYGDLYAIDVERDQTTGFTNPNLHRRVSDALEELPNGYLHLPGTHETIDYPDSEYCSVKNFDTDTILDVPTITKYNGSQKYIEMSEVFVEKGYTTIGNGCFTDTDVVYVEIPEGITTIE